MDLPVNSGSGGQTTQNGWSAGWQASLDGLSNWVPVQGQYPNPITMPDPATTSATLMWYPVPNGNGADGPSAVFFRNDFELDQLGTQSSGFLRVAADDWARIWINGHVWGEYLLTDHQDPTGQPLSLTLSVQDIQQYLNVGRNQLTIEAHDGGASPFNRAYEWLFVDGMAFDQPVFVSPRSVPAPSSLSLVLLAVGAMAAGLRRRHAEK